VLGDEAFFHLFEIWKRLSFLRPQTDRGEAHLNEKRAWMRTS